MKLADTSFGKGRAKSGDYLGARAKNLFMELGNSDLVVRSRPDCWVLGDTDGFCQT